MTCPRAWSVLFAAFFVGLSVLTAPGEASGADVWWVDADAGSGGDGSELDPFDTIADATQVVGAGDVVRIKGGGSPYVEEVLITKDGLPGQPITYEGHGLSRPVIVPGATPVANCLRLQDAAYVTIRWVRCQGESDPGDDFSNTTVLVKRSSHIEFRDSEFVGGTRSIAFLDTSSYNTFAGNRVEPVEVDPCSSGYTDCGPEAMIVSGTHNLVEDNEILNGGHNALQVRGSSNVIRGNVLKNPDWRPVHFLPADPEADPTERNLFERNVIFGTTIDPNKIMNQIQLHAPRNIIRFNEIYGNTGNAVRLNRPSNQSFAELAEDFRDNRIYHNVFYGNGQGGNNTVGFSLGVSGFAGNASGNALVNNVILGNDEASEVQIEFEGTEIDGIEGTRIVSNVIRYEDAGDDVFAASDPPVCDESSGSAPSPGTLSEWQDCSSLVEENLEADPLFRDPDGTPDFRLRSDSSLVDQGVFLTEATQAATNTTSVTVEDAGFFSAGITDPTTGEELAEGDELLFSGGELRRITSIDYGQNVLYFDGQAVLASVSVGDPITLRYNGDAPEIGAHEWSHVIDETAETYTIVPSGDNDPTNPGDGDSLNWTVTEYTSATVQVADEGGERGQVIAVDNPDPELYALRRFFGAVSASSSTPFVAAEMKIRIDDRSLGSRAVLWLAQSGTEAAYLLFDVAAQDELIAKGASTSVPVLSALEEGVWYHVVVTADLTAETYGVRVFDLRDGSEVGDPAANGIPFFGSTSSVDKLEFRSTFSAGQPSTNRADLLLDDLAVRALSVVDAAPAAPAWSVDFEGTGCSSATAGSSTPSASNAVSCDEGDPPLNEGLEYAVFGPGGSGTNGLSWANVPGSTQDATHFFTACLRPDLAGGEDERMLFVLSESSTPTLGIRFADGEETGADPEFRVDCDGTLGARLPTPGANGEWHGMLLEVDPVAGVVSATLRSQSGQLATSSCAWSDTSASFDSAAWEVPGSVSAWSGSALAVDDWRYFGASRPGGAPACGAVPWYRWLLVGDPGNPDNETTPGTIGTSGYCEDHPETICQSYNHCPPQDPEEEECIKYEWPEEYQERGAVSYVYEAAELAVSVGDWVAYLNATGQAADSRALSPSTGTDDIPQLLKGSQGSYVAVAPSLPWPYADRDDAMRFVNWVASADPSTGAYDCTGTPCDLDRLQGAAVFLPTLDEAEKAMAWEPLAGEYWDYPGNDGAAPHPGVDANVAWSIGFGDFGNCRGAGVGPHPDAPCRPMPLGSYPHYVSPWGLQEACGNGMEWTESPGELGGELEDERGILMGMHPWLTSQDCRPPNLQQGEADLVYATTKIRLYRLPPN